MNCNFGMCLCFREVYMVVDKAFNHKYSKVE